MNDLHAIAAFQALDEGRLGAKPASMDNSTMVAATLKPCPFCGFDAVVPVCVYHPYGYAIGCVKCRAKGPSYKADNAAEIPPEAIAAWNAHQSETGAALPSDGREALREALAEAYRKGATDVHNYWTNNPGEPPQGDPEFGEAASDYAHFAIELAALAQPVEAGEDGA